MKTAVIGLGYSGLPLAIRLSQSSFYVLGIDINHKKIEKLQAGILPFAQDEPYLKVYLEREFKKGRISFTLTFERIRDNDLIFINVDTPIKGKLPDYSSLINAIKSISPNLKRGSIVIIESTVSPKTTETLVIPTIENHSNLKVNKDFFVATVPERIRPSHIFEQLTTLSRVIGISDKKIEPTLKKIYSKITSGEIDFTDLTTAETVKTVENSFRDVNIAFANEVALACEELGVNVWEVRELVNKSPFHNMHRPGAGVGGHCLPKDPWLLAATVKNHKMRLIEAARTINDQMPLHILDLVKEVLKKNGKDVKNSKLAILGFSYVENTDDIRNSPTQKLVEILDENGIHYQVHDPFVQKYNSSWENIVKGTDCIVLMVAHDFYKKINLKRVAELVNTKIVVDGRNFFDKKELANLGFIYKGIGNV